jgi:hypothetical protein
MAKNSGEEVDGEAKRAEAEKSKNLMAVAAGNGKNRGAMEAEFEEF